jgi:flagellar hook-basal body complex protein FliE
MSLPVSLTGGINAIGPSGGVRPATPAAKGGEFGSMLTSAIQEVNRYQTDASQSIQSFLSGTGEELHNVAVATQRAELAFDLGMQIRNKVVGAYQEIMKMQL